MKPLSLTLDELTELLGRRYGKGAYHARALYRHIFRHGRLTPSGLPELDRSPALAAALASDWSWRLPPVVAIEREADLTKFTTRLDDGHTIESVIVPMATHATVCLSTQAGCRMGCRFCRTGALGLARNLSVAEIVAQVLTARRLHGAPLRNAVFMGMGEPLDNLEAVVQAMRVMAQPLGLAMPLRYMTLSTVGLTAGIRRLATLDLPRLNLAISLNAPNDAIRSRLMPINRSHGMHELREALLALPLFKRERLLIAYVLIDGINDTPAHARELAAYLAPLPVRVNLIAYNPLPGLPFAPPSDDALHRFRAELVAAGVFVRRRGSPGRSVMAACGQLGQLDTGQRR
jgi:23S rRNA (adenine2503-C2)-methyltransferase